MNKAIGTSSTRRGEDTCRFEYRPPRTYHESFHLRHLMNCVLIHAIQVRLTQIY